eukprot:9516264-Lingulodinium_polyedra.AAC.1
MERLDGIIVRVANLELLVPPGRVHGAVGRARKPGHKEVHIRTLDNTPTIGANAMQHAPAVLHAVDGSNVTEHVFGAVAEVGKLPCGPLPLHGRN